MKALILYTTLKLGSQGAVKEARTLLLDWLVFITTKDELVVVATDVVSNSKYIGCDYSGLLEQA